VGVWVCVWVGGCVCVCECVCVGVCGVCVSVCECVCVCVFLPVAHRPQWTMASSFTRFLNHTQRRITVFRAPLDE